MSAVASVSVPRFPTQTVKNFPLGHGHEPKSDRSRQSVPRLPRAYIGNSARSYTILPFSLLFLVSLIYLISISILSFRHSRTVDKMHLHSSIFLCFVLGILTASSSIIGLRVLKNSVVSAYKLCGLHMMMLTAIMLHIFIPIYQFVPQKENKGNQTERFPNAYWKCQNMEAEKPKSCSGVWAISLVFWGTLVTFLFLLVAWRASLCKNPIPIHPEAKNSSDFRNIQRKSRRQELNSMYKLWQIKSRLDKPYLPHFHQEKDDNDNSNASTTSGNDNDSYMTKNKNSTTLNNDTINYNMESYPMQETIVKLNDYNYYESLNANKK